MVREPNFSTGWVKIIFGRDWVEGKRLKRKQIKLKNLAVPAFLI